MCQWTCVYECEYQCTCSRVYNPEPRNQNSYWFLIPAKPLERCKLENLKMHIKNSKYGSENSKRSVSSSFANIFCSSAEVYFNISFVIITSTPPLCSPSPVSGPSGFTHIRCFRYDLKYPFVAQPAVSWLATSLLLLGFLTCLSYKICHWDSHSSSQQCRIYCIETTWLYIWPCSFFFMLSKVTLRSGSPVSSDVENKLKKSSNVSPSTLEVQKLPNFRMPLPSSRIYGQQKGSYFIHMIKIIWLFYRPKWTWMQTGTFVGLKSEKMIPNSWMCFSPLTKSHPNFLTTSSERHPSWPITDSREPPDW